MQAGSFTASESCTTARHPTKRAPDAGDSAAISSSFSAVGLFLADGLRRPKPPAQVTQTVRWLSSIFHYEKSNHE